MTRDASFAYFQSHEPQELFDIKETKLTVPEPARIFQSYTCDRCGESTGSNWIHLHGEEKLCPDCYEAYDRFAV